MQIKETRHGFQEDNEHKLSEFEHHNLVQNVLGVFDL